MHCGYTQDEDGTRAEVDRDGTLYALPRTPAGLDAFAADLLATGPEQWDENGPNRLMLPASPRGTDSSWDSINLDLLPPSRVQAAPAQQGAGAGRVRLTLPMSFDSGAPAQAKVSNGAAAYGRRQAGLKLRLEEQQRKEQAAAAAPGEGAAGGAAAMATDAATAAAAAPAQQPDSEEVLEAKWRALRDKAMADLQAALAAMLRQAVRYRRAIDFPTATLAPPAAAGDDAGCTCFIVCIVSNSFHEIA